MGKRREREERERRKKKRSERREREEKIVEHNRGRKRECTKFIGASGICNKQ